MIIRKYGIELHRLKKTDIELVRQKRNLQEIRSKMFFQKEITPEMQEKWFKSISNIHNYFFLISQNGTRFGMINGKNVDFQNKSAEGGIFLWDENYFGTIYPVAASMIMAELTFNLMGLEQTFAEIRTTNRRVKEYNNFLGYETLKDFPEEEKSHCVLTRNGFETKTLRLQKHILQLSGQQHGLSWDDVVFENEDLEEKEKLYSGLPQFIQKIIDQKFDGLRKS